MKISLLFLALVAGSIAANIDESSAHKAAKKLDELDQELEEFLIEDDDEEEEEDEFDEEEEDEDQSSLVKSLTFLQGRAGICAGKAKGSCNKQGGECVTAPFADNCKAIHGDAGKLKKQACKSKDCQCCVPPPTCGGKIKKSCSKNGGYCVLKPFKSNCKGGTLNKKSCKGKYCQCCTPATTGGTGGNKDTTVKPATTVEKTQPPQTTVRPTTTPTPAPITELCSTPPPTTTAPPPPTTTAPPPPTTTAPPPPTTTAPPPPTTTAPPPPTTTAPPPPTTTQPPPTTTLPVEPPTTPPPTTTPPPPPTTTPPPPPTTTPPPPPTTTPPPPPTTTPPPPTTTPPPPPTTTPPPPTTTPPPPTTTPPPPPTTTPPPPTTTPPPPPTTTPPAPTTRAVPEDNLLPSIVIRDENLEWSCGWFCTKKVTYTLVLARGYGNEEEFIYIQKSKFTNGYNLDTLIDVCDLQYGTYELDNGRKAVFMVYHDTSLRPYQKRFKLHEDGLSQDILNAVGLNIDSENFPGTSTSSSFWDFSWLTGNYLKNVDC